MKKFWASIGKAILYFLLFVGVQVVVQIPFIFAETFRITFRNIQDGGIPNVENITKEVITGLGGYIYWLTLLSSIITLAILVVVFYFRKKNVLEETQAKRFSVIFILPVFIVALSLQMILPIGMSFLPIPQHLLEEMAQYVGLVTSEISLLTVLTVGVLVPITEEVIFRGLVFTRLKKGMPMVVALIIQALLFGVLHIGVLWLIQAFMMGLIFGLLAQRFQSILPAILAHMVLNISGLLMNELLPEEWNDMVSYIIFAVSLVAFAVSMFFILKDMKHKKTPEIPGQS